MKQLIFQALRICFLLTITLSLSNIAQAGSYTPPLQGEREEIAQPIKAVIESIDLEARTLTLHENPVKLAEDVHVITHDNQWMPVSDLHPGLIIEYLFSPETPDEISQIRLLSDTPDGMN